MGADGIKAEAVPTGLTPRQEKWFASIKASLERETGKSLDEWVAIARTCPETTSGKRAEWLRIHHGLGVNRAMNVLAAAFPNENGWDGPEKMRETLWADPASRAILEAIEAVVRDAPQLVSGQRKSFTGFSREFQFAAAKPVKGGGVKLGIAVPLATSPRLAPPKNESWSERCKGVVMLASPAEVDAEIAALLRQAWEAS